jgi:hypothetical protein
MSGDLLLNRPVRVDLAGNKGGEEGGFGEDKSVAGRSRHRVPHLAPASAQCTRTHTRTHTHTHARSHAHAHRRGSNANTHTHTHTRARARIRFSACAFATWIHAYPPHYPHPHRTPPHSASVERTHTIRYAPLRSEEDTNWTRSAGGGLGPGAGDRGGDRGGGFGDRGGGDR